MPYIKPTNRSVYNVDITTLAEHIKTMSDKGKTAGELNYVITKLLKEIYRGQYSYSVHNEIIGMLECCKQEWYRRLVSPYEDLKIIENGDVEP
jgi:hypothetical protein